MRVGVRTRRRGISVTTISRLQLQSLEIRTHHQGAVDEVVAMIEVMRDHPVEVASSSLIISGVVREALDVETAVVVDIVTTTREKS